MKVEIPADLTKFVESAISGGAFKDEGEVVGAALRLLQNQEQLHAELRRGFEELSSGAAAEYDQRGLASRFENIKATGRQRQGLGKPRDDSFSALIHRSV